VRGEEGRERGGEKEREGKRRKRRANLLQDARDREGPHSWEQEVDVHRSLGLEVVRDPKQLPENGLRKEERD